MAAEELDVVAEREQLAADRGNQRRVVAIGEVGAPDRALEQHVAHQRDAERGRDEDDMPRRVARAMQHGEFLAGDRDGLAFLEPAVGRDGLAFHPVARALLGQAGEEELIGAVRPLDRHAERLCEFRRRAGMVEMAMGEQDALHRHPGLADRRLDAVGIAAGVDHHALLRLVVPDEGAVLLEGRDRDDGGGDAHAVDLGAGSA